MKNKMRNTLRKAGSLQAQLYHRFETMGNRPALAFHDPAGGYQWQTFEQVYDKAARFVPRLKAQGLSQGDVCILALPSGQYCAFMILATLFIGAVPLLISPPVFQGSHSNLKQILARMVRKTKARLVVGMDSIAFLAEDLQKSKVKTRVLVGNEEPPASTLDPVALVAPHGEAVAAMQLTSGTTGFPRVCVWTHTQVLAALEGMASAMALRDTDVCFNWTPLYHDMGLVNNFFFCLTNGIPLAMLSPHEFVKQPALWLEGLSKTRSTMTWSPNFGFALAAKRIKDEEIKDVNLGDVRAFWNAAERIHPDTMYAFRDRFAGFGLRVDALKTNFGCAENVGGATFSDPDGSFLVEAVDSDILLKRRIAQPVNDGDDEARVTSVVGVGRPYPGMAIKILSRTGQPLPDGHVGEVALKSPSRMTGYLGDVRKTRRAIRDHLLRTGDLGYMRGNELFWVGRVSERIAVRGKKLDPSDFELILLNVAGVRTGCFVAFGVDDAKRGDRKSVV